MARRDPGEMAELAELRARIAALEAAEGRRRLAAALEADPLGEAAYRAAPAGSSRRAARDVLGVAPAAGISRRAAGIVALSSAALGVALGALVFSPGRAPEGHRGSTPESAGRVATPTHPARDVREVRLEAPAPVDPPGALITSRGDADAARVDAAQGAACEAAKRLAAGNDVVLAAAQYRRCAGPDKAAARSAIDAASFRVATTKKCRAWPEVDAAASVGASSGKKVLRNAGCEEPNSPTPMP